MFLFEWNCKLCEQKAQSGQCLTLGLICNLIVHCVLSLVALMFCEKKRIEGGEIRFQVHYTHICVSRVPPQSLLMICFVGVHITFEYGLRGASSQHVIVKKGSNAVCQYCFFGNNILSPLSAI